MSYTSLSKKDIKIMLDKLEISNVDELFNIVSEKFKIDFSKFDLPESYSEQEILKHISEISDLNSSTKNLCFVGGGAYDHYVPKVVDFLSSRSEFYTAYTPYQPEVSQGTLQYLYEFQTMICELSGMDIANASLYDGASAVAEACSMSVSSNRKNKILLSSTLNNNYIDVVKTYFSTNNVKLELINNKSGLIDYSDLSRKIDENTSCIVVQSPNANGLLENWEKVVKNKKYQDILVIAVSDPVSLSLVKTPYDCGCDVYVGEGQSLGNHLSFGGPYIGLFATLSKYARKIPGRIIGRTDDIDGKEGFVMTLQTREQHIRRDRATSNICTNQGLIALRSTIYMSLLGKDGLPEIADICFQNAQYAANQLNKIKGLSLHYNNREFLKEFVLKVPFSASKFILDAEKEGFLVSQLPGNSSDSLLLLAFTEKRTKEDIDNLVNFFKNYK